MAIRFCQSSETRECKESSKRKLSYWRSGGMYENLLNVVTIVKRCKQLVYTQ